MPYGMNYPQFQFNPDQNDPELALLRRRALLSGQQDQRSTLDELNRSGLAGSGAAFGVLGEAQNRTNQGVENATNTAFGHQRNEQFDVYKQALDFQNQMKLLREQQHQSTLGSIASIGKTVGSFLVPEAAPAMSALTAATNAHDAGYPLQNSQVDRMRYLDPNYYDPYQAQDPNSYMHWQDPSYFNSRPFSGALNQRY
jgi:hypothetical protein